MESLKIVVSNPFFYPFEGGIEHRMHKLCRVLADRGHDVRVLTARLPGTEAEEETESGYTIVRVPCRTIDVYNPPYIVCRDTLETLRRIRPDIVDHQYRWAPSFDKDIASFDGRKVFTYHNMWGEGVGFQKVLSEINDGLYRSKLVKYDRIIAITDAVREDLIRRGMDGDTITVIDNCLEVLPPVSETEGDFILSLGRMVATKGLKYLVEAMRDVDYRLIMCGKGPESQRISRLIARYGLEDRIELRGWVSDEERERLMSECRFFVMPSIQEAYGLAATEVLAHGKPMICTDVDGLPGNVKDAGLYVRPKDSAGLAEAINRLLSDDCLRKELAGNAVKVTRAFTWEGQVAKTEEVYRSVLNG